MLSRITGIVGWLGVALVFSAVAIRFLRPQNQDLWWNLAAAGLVCVLIYMIGQWRDFLGFFARRQTRYGALSIASIVIVLAILAGLNYVASRQHKRWDLSASQEFTLSDQTRKVLQNLANPLEMTVFAREGEFPRFRERLQEYGYASNKVQVRYVDIEKEPTVATQYGVTQQGTIAVKFGDRIERATTDSEQTLTNAIVKAVEGTQKKVYFVQGHGERDTGSADERQGYSGIAQALGRDNFVVEALPLAQKAAIPEDASVVIVAGPTIDFTSSELEILRPYLDKGGKLLLLLDPPTSADAPPMPNLKTLALEWGVDVGENIVIDQVSLGGSPLIPVALAYPPHAITEGFRLQTTFPLVRAISPSASAPTGRTAQSIVESSAASWAESDIRGLLAQQDPTFDEAAGDKRGPVSLGAAISAGADDDRSEEEKVKDTTPKRETRLVVLGDSDFASNAVLRFAGNENFFLNAVNWLALQENLIAIRPKEPEDRRITMSQTQLRALFFFAVVFLPAAVLVAGVNNWWRRRS